MLNFILGLFPKNALTCFFVLFAIVVIGAILI
jgi:hypothetical protein